MSLELGPALASATTVFSMLRGAVAARDHLKAEAISAEMTTKLNDLAMAALASSEKALAIQDELRALKEELHDLKLNAADRERYALTEVCPGSYAYMSKPSHSGNSEPTHYLCQPCRDQGVKSVLRLVEAQWGWVYSCPVGGSPHEIGLPARPAT